METYTRIDQYDTTFVNHLKLNIILTSANPSVYAHCLSVPEIRKSYSRFRSHIAILLCQSVRLTPTIDVQTPRPWHEILMWLIKNDAHSQTRSNLNDIEICGDGGSRRSNRADQDIYLEASNI